MIDKLVSSKKNFIFSCRACAKKQSDCASLEEVKEVNKRIYDNVLDYFRKKGIKLWVARFSTNKRSFIEALKTHKTTELMITNYELQEFPYKKSDVIEIMRYKDFMKDIDKYLYK